jgi:uncharacterized LabA/DUF88 family protein
MSSAENKSQVKQPQRVGCYIDGFNLYFGMRAAEMRKHFWLDVCALASKLKRPDQTLSYTKYFTARISGGRHTDTPEYRRERDAKRKRQSDYLEAIQAVCDVQVIEGHFRDNAVRCNGCGRTWNDPEEKMTDVNIATQLIFDAFANRFDVAIVVSADSDLVPPIREIRANLQHKRVDVAFPPLRHSNELKAAAYGLCEITENKLRKSQLPEEVVLPNGYTVKRPDKWH